MTKDTQINLRVDDEENRMLEELAEQTVRTKSDMVRFLIRKEYQALVSVSSSSQAETEIKRGK